MRTPERRQYSITLDEVASNAKEAFLRDGKHEPTLILEGNGNPITITLKSMPGTHGERVDYMSFIGEMEARYGTLGELQQVFMIAEAWVRADVEEESKQIFPPRNPERKEILVVSSKHLIERKQKAKVFEILRDSDGKAIALEEVPLDKEREEPVEDSLLNAFTSGYRNMRRLRFN